MMEEGGGGLGAYGVEDEGGGELRGNYGVEDGGGVLAPMVMRTSIQLLHPQPLLLYILDQLLELVHAN